MHTHVMVIDLEESPFVGCFREYPPRREHNTVPEGNPQTIIECIHSCKKANSPLAAVNVM